MKLLINIFFFLSVPVFALAQQDVFTENYSAKQADSLRTALQHSTNDTMRMRLSRSMANYYQEVNRDSSLYFGEQQLALAKKLKLKFWEADALDQMAWVLSNLKNYPLSLQYFLEGFKIFEDRDCEKNIWHIKLFTKDGNPATARLHSLAFIYNDISQLYKATGNKDKELDNLIAGLNIGKSIKAYDILAITKNNLAELYIRIDKPDSALFYAREALINMDKADYKTYQGDALKVCGNIYLNKKNYLLARQYFNKSISAYREQHVITGIPNAYLSLANLFKAIGKTDSSIYYTKRALTDYRHFSLFINLNGTYASLYDLYKLKGNKDSAFFYLQLYKALNDSLANVEKEKIGAYQNVGFNEQIKNQEEANKRDQRENEIRVYILIAAIGVFMVIAFLLYRNNRNRRKANELLEKQKEEIETQKSNVENTLSELRSAQTQLIQREKMASLGELTAGIAHEIQNPLNFVNNFSEVSVELLTELKEEAEAGHKEDVIAIADDLTQNLQKINHHGKRADSIVKGMLEHSRIGTGEKQPTDLNALADEFLKLSYHGLRAKDKNFNVELVTNYNEHLPQINVIPQDIGRVFFNLFNNAFYAVNQRSKTAGADYKPTVEVSTLINDGQAAILVKDNGSGIADSIKDKIMQPFFTTKPTGEGIGLGLSLSYDIVIKGHGGSISVDSKEGESTTFTIWLPVLMNL